MYAVLGEASLLVPGGDKHESFLKECIDVQFPQIPTESAYLREP